MITKHDDQGKFNNTELGANMEEIYWQQALSLVGIDVKVLIDVTVLFYLSLLLM
jgi:hypothetical protein